ncbi:MAG: extracellular solute-binding protein [Pleurocapsa sp. SU_196_0]|nr:extracellular solute-binding protein [Pleurocapsa sp. SU_196_0]
MNKPHVLLVGLLTLSALGAWSVSAQQSAQINGGKPVTLKVWDQYTEGDTVPQIYKNFMAKYPNVTLQREAISTDQMRQTVKTALGSGTGPDVLFYDAGPGYAGVLAEANLIQPLEKYATEFGWKKNIAPAALTATTINAQVYGVPTEVDLIGMYVNRTLVAKAGLKIPKTIAELKTFCTQAVAKGYIPMAFGDNPGWQAFHQFSMVANNMAGPQAILDLLYRNKGSWNSAPMINAIRTYFVELRDAGCYPKTVNALKNEDLEALFNSGKALTYPTGSWMAASLSEAAAKNKWTLEMVAFPAIAGGKGSYLVTGVGSAWFVSKASANKDAAAAFINYLISAPAAKLWVEGNGSFLPIKVSVSSLKVSPLVRNILNSLQASIAGRVTLGQNIDVLAPPEFNTAMQEGFQAVLAGQKTPEQQAADLQKAWEAGRKK